MEHNFMEIRRRALAHRSDGSLVGIQAAARIWDDSCTAEADVRRLAIVITSDAPLSDEAKESIRLASPATVLLEYRHRNAPPAPPPDPWVKVGTTTIDGTLIDIANMLDASSWPLDWDRDAEAAIDLFVRSAEPWLIGGRHLLARGSHINGHIGTALIRCDIVRRQSEIDAEMVAAVAPTCNEIAAAMRPTCPECGPHGNAGRVLLLESWVDCATCKPAAIAGTIPNVIVGFPDDAFSLPPICLGCMSNGMPMTTDGLCLNCDKARGHKPGEGFAVPIGARVSGPHGRVGTVIPFDGYTPYENGVRIKMDSGWIGIYDRSDITIIS